MNKTTFEAYSKKGGKVDVARRETKWSCKLKRWIPCTERRERGRP